jgi:hypothetical protein
MKNMKCVWLAAAVLGVLFLSASQVYASGSCYDGACDGIRLVDMSDAGNTVTVSVKNIPTWSDLWYRETTPAGTSTWVHLGTGFNFSLGSFTGGTILDFALDLTGNGLDAKDQYSFRSSDATITFGRVLFTNQSYASIDWKNSCFKFDLVLAQGRSDVLQRADTSCTVVPIPAAAVLFGSGLLGLMGFGVKRRRNALPK